MSPAAPRFTIHDSRFNDSRPHTLTTCHDIEAAARRIKGAVYESPCTQSIPLSELTGMEIYCKLDNLQRTGSFKERGARNALSLIHI